MSPDVPIDPRLAEVAELLEGTQWGAELYDDQSRLVWISDQLKAVVGETDPTELGYGKHVMEQRLSPIWRKTISREQEAEMIRVNAPYVAHDTPGGIERVKEIIGDRADPELVAGLEAKPPPPMWTFDFDYAGDEGTVLHVQSVAFRLFDAEGSFIGTANIHNVGMSALLLTLVAAGDQEMFMRMAELREPAQHDAAILFADVEASGELARRLPSSAYFELIRRLTTAIDAVVLENRGIVGKHAGDGVSAFFLAEQAGSRSAAVAAALASAREIGAAAERLSASDDLPVEPGECLMNVGVHWGEGLFMGQVVTGGRLEVTALGDAVNEAARIEQSAKRGARLASRAAFEQLEAGDAERLGIDPGMLRYTLLGELEGASEKAVRDAGGLPLAEI